MLVNEGLLVQVQGKGDLCEKENISFTHWGRIAFAESLESQHLSFTTEVIDSYIEKVLKRSGGKVADRTWYTHFSLNGSVVWMWGKGRLIEK